MSKKETKEVPALLKQERTLRFFIVSLVINIVAAFIVWPLIDMLCSAIFQHDFAYTVSEHIIQPAIVMFIFTSVEFLTWDVWHKPARK